MLHALELGYTGKCTLNGQMLFLTSLGITHNTNLIKSSAIKPIYKNNQFTRFGTAAFKDWSTYEISISFELHTHHKNNKDDSFSLVQDLFKEHFRKPISLRLEAASKKDPKSTKDPDLYELQFNRCYVSSFSLSIENNAIATASMNLLYFDEVFPFTEESSSSSDGSNVAHGDIFYPYYSWGLQINGSSNPINILNNFSFNFQQSITPKQGINKCNKEFEKAHDSGRPIYVTMSMPTMTFDMTYILTDKKKKPLKINDDDNEGYNRSNQNLENLLTHIDFKNSFSSSSSLSHFADLFKFTLVYDNKRSKTGNKENKTGDEGDFLDVEQSVIESITPNLANSGSINTISLSGTIYKIK